jgi:benzylsuccinate CoA-transferase BbsF subunit
MQLFLQLFKSKKIVEWSYGLAGQQCAYTFLNWGAQVVQVQHECEGIQRPSPSLLDTHKQKIHLNPSLQEDFELLVKLCTNCDLLIEERAPMGWAEYGPLHQRLLQRIPDLITVCITPFGLTGPHANLSAYPLNVYHSAGNAQQIPCDLLRPQDRLREPLQTGGQWGEAQVGTLAATAAMATLLHPQHNQGTVIDCSKQELLISLNWTETVRFPNEGRSPSRLEPLATIVGGILPTQDGFIQIAVREDRQWLSLTQLLKHPEWATDPNFSTRQSRISNAAAISRILAAQTIQYSTHHLHQQGRELGIPIAAVFAPSQLLNDVDLNARNVWQNQLTNNISIPRWDMHITSALFKKSNLISSVKLNQVHKRLPLQGLRVLDFGWVAMGPYAGYELATLGAEVIHIAKPPPKHTSDVNVNHQNYGFDTLNTGKKWLGIDLKTPQGLKIIHQLVDQCDIVLNNFRPGVTQRLGIDFETLSAINPQLVMLSASTYGESHISQPYVGYAPVFSALAGLAHLTGYADGPPAEISHPVDFFAGSVGVMGLIGGLHRRQQTGTGCHIDLSAREAVLWSLTHCVTQIHNNQSSEIRLGNGHPTMAPHGAYPCLGLNQWMSIAIGSDAQWQRLCQCMEDLSLCADSDLKHATGRQRHQERINQRIANWTSNQTIDDLWKKLQTFKIASFPTVGSEELWNDAHLHDRQVFQSRQSPTGERWYVSAPWIFNQQKRDSLITIENKAAVEDVLVHLLNQSSDEIDRWIESKVVVLR